MSLFFETIKVNQNKAFNLEYHQKRMQKTVFDHFNITKTFDLDKIINPPDNSHYRCKIIYDKDIIDVLFYPYIPRVFKTFKLIHSNIKYDYKWVNRKQIQDLFLQRGNCDDIIIVKNNLITDTSIANIAILHQDRWQTPKTPLLKGTIREKLLNENKLYVKQISVKELLSAKKIAIMNALIGFKILDEYEIV